MNNQQVIQHSSDASDLPSLVHVRSRRLRRIATPTRACIVVAALSLAAASTAGAATNLSGLVASDTTWTLANSPYVVTNNVTVNAGATLTIEPGVVVKFHANKGLTLKGRIVANGIPTARIVFTSIKDDSVGGDTGGDGVSVGGRGDWTGITVSTTDIGADSEMSFVDIAYAGQYYAALYAFNSYSSLSFDNSTVSHSAFHGIAGQSKRAETNRFVLTMRSSAVSDSARNGLLILDTAAVVSGSTFTHNGYQGINIQLSSYFAGAGTQVTDSDIHDNTGAGVALYVDPFLPPSRKPNGHLNNIHDNNFYPAPYLHHGVQLFSHKQHDDSDWSENYWGEKVGSRSCDPKYNFLYRRHQVFFTDVTFVTPVNGSSLGLPGVIGCTRDVVVTENPALTPFARYRQQQVDRRSIVTRDGFEQQRASLSIPLALRSAPAYGRLRPASMISPAPSSRAVSSSPE